MSDDTAPELEELELEELVIPDFPQSGDSSLRNAIGALIVRDVIDRAEASRLLLWLRVYKEVPRHKQAIHHPLAAAILIYLQHAPSTRCYPEAQAWGYIYRTSQVCAALCLFYTSEEQQELLEYLMGFGFPDVRIDAVKISGYNCQ